MDENLKTVLLNKRSTTSKSAYYMLPRLSSSRTGKFKHEERNQNVGPHRVGGHLTGKGYLQIFWDDGDVHYFHLIDDYMGSTLVKTHPTVHLTSAHFTIWKIYLDKGLNWQKSNKAQRGKHMALEVPKIGITTLNSPKSPFLPWLSGSLKLNLYAYLPHYTVLDLLMTPDYLYLSL